MKIRATQIWGFLLSVLGWIFVACSLAMEGWKVTSIGGQGGSAVMSVAWYWSSLWRACFTDSASTTNCYDFPVLWSVEGYLQIVRALLMSGMALGVLGFILSLVGMECTYIGGKEKEKNRSVCVGGICQITSAMLSAAGYVIYAEHVSADVFNPKFDGLRFDLGSPLFLGWSGCAFQITGGIFFLVSVCKNKSQTRSSLPALSAPVVEGNGVRSSRTNISIISELSTNSKTSAISDLSSKSETSVESKALSKKSRVTKTQRPSRSRQTRGSFRSEVSESVSSSRSSRTDRSHVNNKMSSPSGGTTHQFVKNSYL